MDFDSIVKQAENECAGNVPVPSDFIPVAPSSEAQDGWNDYNIQKAEVHLHNAVLLDSIDALRPALRAQRDEVIKRSDERVTFGPSQLSEALGY